MRKLFLVGILILSFLACNSKRKEDIKNKAKIEK